MKLILDAFWRAAAYCVLPRVIGLSVLPVVVAGGLSLVLGYFYWEGAVAGVNDTLRSWSLIDALVSWTETFLGTGLRTVLAPLVVVVLVVPVVLLVSLLLVAVLMTPAIVSLVAERRFPALERRHGAGLVQSALWSMGYTVAALVMLVMTVPLWLVPPLVLLLPPVIWGWLTTKVLGFDVLAVHASADERRRLLREHRWPMLTMGVIAGFLGAAPSLIWAAGAMTLVFAPLLVVVSVWLYTLVFAFAALWFAHYALGALQADRLALAAVTSPAAATGFDLRSTRHPGPVVDVLELNPPPPAVGPYPSADSGRSAS